MNRQCRIAAVLVALVLMLGAAASWGQLPASNDTSDNQLNTGGGSFALRNNSNGYYNTAYGMSALSGNTTGGSNTAVGVFALYGNIIGNDNTATGYGALEWNYNGTANIANGGLALAANYDGSYNTANGLAALYKNQHGGENSALATKPFTITPPAATTLPWVRMLATIRPLEATTFTLPIPALLARPANRTPCTWGRCRQEPSLPASLARRSAVAG